MSERDMIETELEKINFLSTKMGFDVKFEAINQDGKLYLMTYSKGKLIAFASGDSVSEILARMLFNRLYIY